mgnify:CR=1 FL=1
MSAQIDQILERYVALRDRKKELKDDYDNKVEAVDQALEKLENFLLKTMADQGVDSVKTAHGTAYISLKTSATVADRDAFMDYIRTNDEWAMLDVKVNKTAVKEYRDAQDSLPPGVNWSETRAVNVRRA